MSIRLTNTTFLAFALPLLISKNPVHAVQKSNAIQQRIQTNGKVLHAKKISSTVIEVVLANNQKMILDFYSDHIFRLFRDNSGRLIRDPEAKPAAKILVDNPRKSVAKLNLSEENNLVTISTDKVRIQIDKATTLLKIINLASNAVILEETAPVRFDKSAVTLSLKENPQEYFYGGGVQNGRFSHKGKAIAIENQNSWTDGGVASPTPYYWSSNGYGILFHTFKKGRYDFGATEKGLVKLSHETDYLDVFFMAGDGAVALLKAFYQLTGNPVLLPKFGFYQGHLNAYNRDFWKEDEKGILFEDSKRYKESQKENGDFRIEDIG